MFSFIALSTYFVNFHAVKGRQQDWRDLIDAGKDLYVNGRYHEAYRLFTGLKEDMDHPDTEILILYQVRCLENLGYSHQALTRCQIMLQINPNAGLWYIIASNIHLSSRNYHAAWEILHSALQVIPETHHLFQEIYFRERIAWHGMNQPKPMGQKVDMMKRLTNDVLHEIFSRIPFKCLARCTRVSRRWRRYLTSNPHLWRNLDFMSKNGSVNPSTLHGYLSRLHTTSLSSFRLYSEHINGDRILSTLLMHGCSHLHTLDMSEVTCTSDLFLTLLDSVGSTLRKLRWGGITLKLHDVMEQVAKSCPKLTYLDVHDCFTALGTYTHIDDQALQRLEFPGSFFSDQFFQFVATLKPFSITTLVLSSIHGLTASHLAIILCRCPHLVHLQLRHCLVNITPVVNILCYCCPSLQRLFYQRNRFCQQVQYGQLEIGLRTPTVSPHSTLLFNRKQGWHEISIRRSKILTDSVLYIMLYQSNQTLQILDVEGSPYLTDEAFVSVRSTNLPKLKRLCLSDCFGISTQGLRNLISASPHLQHVNLSGLSSVTDVVLQELSECEHLRHVDISHCGSITEAGLKHLIDRRKTSLTSIHLKGTGMPLEVLGYAMQTIKRDNI